MQNEELTVGDLVEISVNMAIGNLVKQKLTSGNSVPVERCTISLKEVQDIFNKIMNQFSHIEENV